MTMATPSKVMVIPTTRTNTPMEAITTTKDMAMGTMTKGRMANISPDDWSSWKC